MYKVLVKRDWQLLMCLCILAPVTHFYVQAYWFYLTTPVIFNTRSHLLVIVWLSLMSLVGAALAAFLLAAPAAWAIKKRPSVLASVITLATSVATLLTWHPSYNNYAAAFTVGELLAFFFFCWLTASVTFVTCAAMSMQSNYSFQRTLIRCAASRR